MERYISKVPAKIGKAGEWREEEIKTVAETNIKIVFNDILVAATACCGIHLSELAVGFLFSEGYIKEQGDIISVTVDTAAATVAVKGKNYLALGKLEKEEPAALTSSGARVRGGLSGHQGEEQQNSANAITIPAPLITPLFDALIANAAIHQQTRGTHSGAICDESGISTLRDDIGRHNVADMLIGHALLEGINLSEKYIVRTGRVSLEIATKYRRAGVRILLSLSVPTSGAIEYARQRGMCLVSSRRDGGIVVYTDYERVK